MKTRAADVTANEQTSAFGLARGALSRPPAGLRERA
ncbi:MAG: hypothetical protein JWM74_6006, partial [Myxococcaceae bacterium]|nr:hypothetical protein [Myxococcaceae bacterium]